MFRSFDLNLGAKNLSKYFDFGPAKAEAGSGSCTNRAVVLRTKVLVIQADVSLTRDIERMVATTLDAFGGHLDVLVNNASVLGPSPMPYLLDYPLEDFQEVLNANLIGPFLLIRKFLPAMIDQGGSIINVTSDAGIVGYQGGAPMASANLGWRGCLKLGRRSWRRRPCV